MESKSTTVDRMANTRGPAVPHYLQPNYDALVNRETPTLLRLSALRSVMQNLEDFESVLVATARNEGGTWDAIGTAMRVTKQAAQKRYAAFGPPDD